MNRSYVYESVNFHKIKNEIYIHVINTQIKKQNIIKNWKLLVSPSS